MNIFFSPYTLYSATDNSSREGMLLRIENENGLGYADCHPWPELSDLPLHGQLKALQNKRSTPLLHQALNHAKIDSKGRKEKRSLFTSLPKSHFLLSLDSVLARIPQCAAWGVGLLKVKVRYGDEKKLLDYTQYLKEHNMKWRLDFNAAFTKEEVERFLSHTSPVHPWIDLIEDPCPYNGRDWHELQQKFCIPLACDFEMPPNEHAFITIHKPSSRPMPSLSHHARVIVTSSLGHPVGQLMAMYTAAILPQACHEVGGFLSHTIYKPTPFSRELSIKDSCLIPPPGTGLGFDTLLDELPWKLIGTL